MRPKTPPSSPRRHDVPHARGHSGKPAPEVIGTQVPHICGANCAVDHRVAEERLPVPADPHETGWDAPVTSVIVQPRHHAPEPAQVHRPGRGGVNTAVHPAQHRAHPRLRHVRGGSHRSQLSIDRAEGRRDEQFSLGSQRRQPVQFRSNRGGGVDVAPMTGWAVHPEQEPITAIGGCRIDPERGVLLISDKPQLRIYQGIRIECPHSHPPHTRNPLVVRGHGATVPRWHSAGNGIYPATGSHEDANRGFTMAEVPYCRSPQGSATAAAHLGRRC